MAKTEEQKHIEELVTNRVGYIENFGYELRRREKILRNRKGDDIYLDLQMHLGVLERRIEEVTDLMNVTENMSYEEKSEMFQTGNDVDSIIKAYHIDNASQDEYSLGQIAA